MDWILILALVAFIIAGWLIWRHMSRKRHAADIRAIEARQARRRSDERVVSGSSNPGASYNTNRRRAERDSSESYVPVVFTHTDEEKERGISYAESTDSYGFESGGGSFGGGGATGSWGDSSDSSSSSSDSGGGSDGGGGGGGGD
jgi:uncharacterized membrane protein YgcG